MYRKNVGPQSEVLDSTVASPESTGKSRLQQSFWLNITTTHPRNKSGVRIGWALNIPQSAFLMFVGQPRFSRLSESFRQSREKGYPELFVSPMTNVRGYEERIVL